MPRDWHLGVHTKVTSVSRTNSCESYADIFLYRLSWVYCIHYDDNRNMHNHIRKTGLNSVSSGFWNSGLWDASHQQQSFSSLPQDDQPATHSDTPRLKTFTLPIDYCRPSRNIFGKTLYSNSYSNIPNLFLGKKLVWSIWLKNLIRKKRTL